MDKDKLKKLVEKTMPKALEMLEDESKARVELNITKDGDKIGMIHYVRQDPNKETKWAQLARDGAKIVQVMLREPKFKYLGVIIYGKLKWY